MYDLNSFSLLHDVALNYGLRGQDWRKLRHPDQLGLAKQDMVEKDIEQNIEANAALEAGGFRILCKNSAEEVALEAARLVALQLAQKPDSSIVFPTGNTPLPMYAALREMSGLDWLCSRLFQLDEYLPPHPGKPVQYESFATFMHRELWGHVDGIKHYFQDYMQAPETYERLVTQDHGPDLAILGIGANGHVAFNEPGSSPDSPTRVIELADETIRNNFGGIDRQEYPKQAITLGLKTILSARKIILLATGESKIQILQRAFNPKTPPSLDCPASWLKTHQNALILTDFKVCFPVD